MTKNRSTFDAGFKLEVVKMIRDQERLEYKALQTQAARSLDVSNGRGVRVQQAP